MAETNGPMCACRRVEYDPIKNDDGSHSDRWRCTLCGSVFLRRRILPASREVAMANEESVVRRKRRAQRIVERAFKSAEALGFTPMITRPVDGAGEPVPGVPVMRLIENGNEPDATPDATPDPCACGGPLYNRGDGDVHRMHRLDCPALTSDDVDGPTLTSDDVTIGVCNAGDAIEAFAEVRGGTVCSIAVPAVEGEERALMRLALALVEHAHEMPRTHPATGVDLCAHGKFAHYGGDAIRQIMVAKKEMPGLVVTVDNDCWSASDDVPERHGLVLQGEDGPEDLAMQALRALGLRAEPA